MEKIFEYIVEVVLKKRIFVLFISAFIFAYGIFQLANRSVDILPDLNRPTVTIFTEAKGLAPEEVELLVTTPIEAVMNGASGVERVRSISSAGLSLVFVEFDWSQDIYLARQIVSEKLNATSLPENSESVLGPIASIMGEIQLIGLTSENKKASLGELRRTADYVVRNKLLMISGVAQVTVIGGEVEQYQIILNPAKLSYYGLTVRDLEDKLEGLVENKSGNFLTTSQTEYPVRIVARTKDLDALSATVISKNNGILVTLKDVAEVKKGSALNPRGSAGINELPGVILSIQKQPGQNTLELSKKIKIALDDLQKSLGEDTKIHQGLFTQEKFISNGISNVTYAIRDAGILVIIILLLFLGNWRALMITLTVLPTSFIMAILLLKWFNIELNVMTLGGLAVAIGELTDDAVVDVENSIRHLKKNFKSGNKISKFKIILDSSREIRGSVIFSTILVTLSFLPMLALSGIEGKLLAPLAIAYITALIASTIIALTITVIFSYYLLPHKSIIENDKDTWLVDKIKKMVKPCILWSINFPKFGLFVAGIAILGSSLLALQAGKEFLPPFNEGTLTINIALPPGSSLKKSNEIGEEIQKSLLKVPNVLSVARRSGRAEEDAHANGVEISELEINIAEGVHKDEVIEDIKEKFSELPLADANISIGQPISHRIEHILSGVRAPLVIKVFGTDLDILRKVAEDIRDEMEKIPGTLNPVVAQEVKVPQIVIEPNRQKIALYDLSMGEATEMIEILLAGKSVGTILEGNRSFELILRLPAEKIETQNDLKRIVFSTPSGDIITLDQIAEVKEVLGRNSISHDNGQRRMVVSSGILNGDSVTIIDTLKEKIAENVDLPEGYFVSFEGTYKSQKESSKKLLIYTILAFLGIILALYVKFREVALVAQVLANIPVTFFGGLLAIYLTGNVINLASLVGLVSLLGLAARNGILLIEHWKFLMEEENIPFSKDLIIQGSLNRITPMLMTSLTSMLALLPLIIGGESPGKEMLYPLSVVVFGGLIVSTIVEIFIRPGMFWMWGQKKDQAKKKLEQSKITEQERIIIIDAEKYKFSTTEIRVKKGEKVVLKINNLDTTHGIRIPSLQQQDNEKILLDTSKSGVFHFTCNNLCGSGHLDMKGRIIIE